MRKNLALAFIMTAIYTVSNAQATATNAPLRGGTCWANIGLKATLDNTTEASCAIIGKVSVGQIYEKGFRIVTVVHNPQHSSFVTIVIEEQR
jgi:hypothetical protein